MAGTTITTTATTADANTTLATTTAGTTITTAATTADANTTPATTMAGTTITTTATTADANTTLATTTAGTTIATTATTTDANTTLATTTAGTTITTTAATTADANTTLATTMAGTTITTTTAPTTDANTTPATTTAGTTITTAATTTDANTTLATTTAGTTIATTATTADANTTLATTMAGTTITTTTAPTTDANTTPATTTAGTTITTAATTTDANTTLATTTAGTTITTTATTADATTTPATTTTGTTITTTATTADATTTPATTIAGTAITAVATTTGATTNLVTTTTGITITTTAATTTDTASTPLTTTAGTTIATTATTTDATTSPVTTTTGIAITSAETTTAGATTAGAQTTAAPTTIPIFSTTAAARDRIRLVGGSNSTEGRVEVRPANSFVWGTVCDDSFDRNDAHVVCITLGYSGATTFYIFGSGTGPIYIDDLACTGTESSLFDCAHRGWGVNDCGHHEDVGVTCFEEPGAPTNLQFITVDTDSVNVTWNASSSADFYRVTYQASGGPEMDSVASTADTTHTIESLSPGTLYTVRVYGIKNLVEGEPLQGDRRTAAAPVRNVSIVEATENSISITWESAPGAKDSYSIDIYPGDGDNPYGSVNDTDPLQYVFTGLTPGALYTINVTTVSGGANSVASTTILRTKPNPPGAITADIVSASIVNWEPSTGGVVSGYQVTYTADDGSLHRTITTSVGTRISSPFALTPGILYTIEVYAFSNHGGYFTESDRKNITVGINTTAPTALLQTCGPSFVRISVLEETVSAITYTVPIPEFTSCPNCSIVYGEATCFIDDVFNVSSYVVANSSSGASCNLIITSPIDKETTPSVRFSVSWTRLVYNRGYVVNEDCGSIPVEILVVDVNDNPPVFGADLAKTLYIRDRTPVQTILAVASAEDADTGTNAVIAYSIPSPRESKYFEVDNNGVVIARHELTQALLRQAGLLLDEQVDVVVMATDGVHNTTTTLALTFIDTGGVNTSASTFDVSVLEEQPAGTPVINLRDQRPFDDENIIYSFAHTSKSFELNSTSGEVTTSEVLDREQEELYELTISASDPGGCYTSASIEITVRVEDVNDHSPVFLETAYSGRIAEDAGRGQPVAIDGRGISATDADLGLNSLIKYGIDCCQTVFAIDEDTGEITTMDSAAFSLDRENKSVYHLTIVARDNPSNESLRESRTNVTIAVLDINDHRPTFIETSPVRITLYENETVGSIVATLEAVDPDEGANGRVFYEIRSGAEGRFTVNSRTGQIKIADELDRETKDFYRLDILASDGGNPPLVADGFYLEILINDVNDNIPTFTAPPYDLTVHEETEAGTVIGNITAEDLDIGGNAQIKYTFTEAVEHFAIDETSGTLTIESIFDFDNVTHPKQSSFTVRASDGTFSSTAEVRVSLTDINDNAPSYRADSYEVTLLYVTFPAIVTAVDATDIDSGTNAAVSYSFVDDSSMLFSINPSNGIIRLVGPPGSTDITYNLTVAATDKGTPSMNSTVSVTIKITTLSDTSSTRVSFNGVEFEGYVEENNNNEQVVTHLDATVQYGSTPAPDCPLHYKLAASSDDFEFTVNETTGEISTRGAMFDREIRARFTFAVVVEITCPQKSFDYTTVSVHVNDTNDESPTFNSSSYNFEAIEGSAGVEVGRVLAVDKDTGSNADFSYTIYPSGSPFRIDTNGKITVSTPLDREAKDSYTLTILAEDMGVPSLNGTTAVHVRVLDINDNAPAFADPVYHTDLSEDANKDELNISISASDDDSGTNGDIRFSLHGDGSHLFSIDDMSGAVHLTGRLDYEERSSYNLTITATDNGHPNRTSSVPLLIEVTDFNDNSPTFDRDNYNASTHRNVPTTEVLVTVSATDQDSGVNALLVYTITGLYGLKPARPTIRETLFNINSSTGDIRVTTHLVDDDIQQYALIITATDMGDTPLSGTTTVVIDVANTNFFAPEFLDTPFLPTITEDNGMQFVPKRVLRVRASDNDTEAEGQVQFLLPSNDDISELFMVINMLYDNNEEVFVAEIWTNAVLDREAHPSGLNLTVLAVDQGATPKTSTVWIHVTLLDVNDNPPTLIIPERVATPQSSPVGTSVVTVDVADPDLDNEFSFKAVSEYFSINETTGEIFTIKDLPDSAGYQYVFLTVDDGISDPELGSISIFVGNPNFHTPMFDQSVYRTTVQQELQVGTNLTGLNIFACDMDCPDSCNGSLSPNCTKEGRLTYGIVENIRDIFVIDAYTGLISTQWPLESTITNYSLMIIATDQAESPRTGSASVWINVVDVGTTPVPTTPSPCDGGEVEMLQTDLDNLRYVLFGVSGFAGLWLVITIGLVVRLVATHRRVKYMSTAHLTTPAFIAPEYTYVPGRDDYAYAEGIGADSDDDTPAPPPVAERPPLRPRDVTLNNELRRAQVSGRGHGVSMEMRSRMRSELQRQDRIEARTRGGDDRSGNSVYRELKYGYLPLNTRDASNAASGPADTALDNYGYMKPVNQTRLNNQRQSNDPYQHDNIRRRSDLYTNDIPSPDYDMLPRDTRL